MVTNESKYYNNMKSCARSMNYHCNEIYSLTC